jgi:hypothetical protein
MFLAARSVLVTILRRESFYFVDEICSRHHFSVRNALFCRRAPFSSPFLSEKRLFLATRLVFVTIFEWETLVFGDEPRFRRHF